MPLVNSLLLALMAFLAGWWGTDLVRRNASRLRLVQIPNERSSHVRPTPQGGGIAIALLSLAGIALAAYQDAGFVVVFVLVLAIAGLGLADDVLDISPAIRFPIQGVALAVLVWWAGPLPPLTLLFGLTIDGWLLSALLWLAGLWWLNLFNFMDGIDGIAASQSLVILLSGAALAISADTAVIQTPIAGLMLTAAAATAGFLVMNWAPAKIFMGDAGSNTLAVLCLVMALWTTQTGLVGYPAWIILLAPFAADATVALIRRSARGERPWRAHRRHAYQQLSRQWGHAPVTTLYTAIAAFAALPLAWMAQSFPHLGWLIALAIYLVLAAFAVWGGSGDAAERHKAD